MEARDRALYFWLGCMPLRAFLATRGDLPALRAAAAVIGGRWVLGFNNGHIGAFGGAAWWREERGGHGLRWRSYAVTGDDRWLKADVAFGAGNWVLSAGRGKGAVGGPTAVGGKKNG